MEYAACIVFSCLRSNVGAFALEHTSGAGMLRTSNRPVFQECGVRDQAALNRIAEDVRRECTVDRSGQSSRSKTDRLSIFHRDDALPFDHERKSFVAARVRSKDQA